MVSPEDIWNNRTRNQKLILGVLISILVAVLGFLLFNPQPEKVEEVSIEGKYELNGTETSFKIICSPIFEDNVLKSGRKYSFNCREKLPSVTKHQEDFGPLAILRLESINGEVIDSEKILDPSQLDEGTFVGKQDFNLDSPESSGRYVLTMEALSDENRVGNRSLNISYDYGGSSTNSFRFYSFEDLSKYDYRRAILILSLLVIVNIGLTLSSKLIEFSSREN